MAYLGPDSRSLPGVGTSGAITTAESCAQMDGEPSNVIDVGVSIEDG
jgi:hypothetical protein